MGDNMIPSGNIGVDFESAQTMNESWHFNAETRNGNLPRYYYLNVVDWLKNGTFNLNGLNNKILSASLHANGKPLDFQMKFNPDAGIHVFTISVPKSAPDPYVSVNALTLEGEVSMDQAMLQQGNGTVILDGYWSTIHDKEIIANKPQHPLDFKMFTIFQKSDGIMPARGI